MTLTRSRRATATTDPAPPIPSTTAEQSKETRRSRTRVTNTITEKNKCDELREDVDKSISISPRTTRITSSSTSAFASGNDAPLTARGTRSTRRTLVTNSGGAAGVPETSARDSAEEDEVETPRRARAESVISLGHYRKQTPLIPWKALSSDDIEGSKTSKALSGYRINLETRAGISYAERLLKALEPIEDDEDYSLVQFSSLSITSSPPPTLLDMGEEYDDLEATAAGPWLMVFDSGRSSSPSFPSSPSRPHRQLSYTTFDDLETAQDSDLDHRRHSFLPNTSSMSDSLDQTDTFFAGVLDEDVGQDKQEDDDPFGFTRVERQLLRTRSLRPKLMAINETNNRTVAAVATQRNSSNGSDPTLDSENSTNSKERLDQSVLEKAAVRRRGDSRNKGKAVDRGDKGATNGSEVNGRSRGDTSPSQMDEDIQRAIQLSIRDVDLESGEGSSSFASSRPATTLLSSRSDLLQGEITSDETTPSKSILSTTATQDVVATISATTRSKRRISRFYGKASAVSVDTQDTPSASDVTSVTETDNLIPVQVLDSDEGLELDNLNQMPTTPQKKPSSPGFDLSFNSDDYPITFETTPKKKPEAGMPLSLESTSSQTTKGRRSQKKQYILTEQLQAMLPRRRRNHRNMNVEQVVSINSGGEDNASFSKDSSEAEEEEFLVRRRGGRVVSRPATTKLPTTTGSKKRSAPAETPAPAPARKRNQPSRPVSSLSKRKERQSEKMEDRSEWTASQLAAQEERIKYFQQVDDFELEVEGV
ncbi:hypothetical protein EDD21DRAFT_360352 [Dissophora ornata]|nr:hypothetical protein BGZ58_002671 [Dissophora ornata]KAI8606656.1 hypothetical protein EDD21DRAFT_360352 [Dissophora ornata]